ncbi:MAG: Gfo/Idh/MocA family protein [bacterium]
MEKEVSFGIIGCGVVAKDHAEAITNTEEAKLIAVVDIDEKKGKEFAKKYQTNFYRDYRDLLALKEIEAVDVCTPSYLHAPISIDTAKAGKHVFVEKPIAINLKQADELIVACRQAKVKLAVVFQTRFSESLQKVKRLFKERKMGRMILADFSIKTYRSEQYYQSWHKKIEFEGGGLMIQQGIHGIDRLQWLMGEVDSVFAFKDTIIHNIEGEDIIVATVKFRNGALGSIEGSTSIHCERPDPLYTESMGLYGENGSINLMETKIVEWNLRENQEPESLEVPVELTQGRLSQVKDFIGAIRGDKEPLVNGEEARKSLEIVIALYKSAKEGRLVKLPLSQ